MLRFSVLDALRYWFDTRAPTKQKGCIQMKKLTALFLSFVMCCCFATVSFAADVTDEYQTPYIEARFSDFANVNIFLKENDFGFLHVEGSAATASSEKYIKVTITLEYYGVNGFESMGDGFTWTSEGYFAAGAQGTRDVSVGSYRAKIYAECWLNGVLLEDVTLYSNTVNVAK